MSKLDPRIEEIRARYELAQDDFWQIPQNKQWVCKHAALEIVATKANVIWDAPQIIQADTGNGIAVLSVAGKLGERSEWATGEASPKNNKNSYPWAMAEKRAKDRVILKLVGIHGLVYSEDEMPTAEPRTTDQRSEQGRREVAGQPETKKTSAAEMKRGLAEIESELLDCETIMAVDKCAEGWRFIAKRDGWTRDYLTIAGEKFAARKKAVEAADAFPGDTGVNGAPLPDHLANSHQRPLEH